MTWWIFILVVLSLILWIAFHPISISQLESHPNPVSEYEEAIARVKAMQEEDNQNLARDVCITKLYDHGMQTEHVIILFHGFTNCPEQFNEIGMQHFEAGHNVFIPRMPYHGLSDRLTDALVNLTAENLATFGDKVIDIAHGLGKKITVMGISGSATLVTWLAQNRADIDFAFAIAPLFGLAFIPPAFTKLFERIALLLPNFFLWWDPRTKADNPYSIYYAYPRYPTRALVEFIRLALITRAQAQKSAPAAGQITMIINDAEPAVSNAEILRLLNLWQKHGKRNLSEVHFEKDMKLPHDIITPGTPGVPIGDIQPRLIGVVRDLTKINKDDSDFRSDCHLLLNMKIIRLIFILLFLSGCVPMNPPQPSLGAGFRYSSYGPPSNPGPEYWASVGEKMAANFPNAKPSTIWIVGILDGEGTYLSFGCETEDPNIRCGYVDINEQTLTLFDEKGFDVWLQVEPGNASVDELIDIVLNQYKHHPSVVGFGVDVEWYTRSSPVDKSTSGPEGQPITDEEAKRWVAAVRKHNPDYKLFLKHWEREWMPPTERDGIFFVDDSQQFESFEHLVNEFSEWGKAFAPAPVGFQYGYLADKVWWKNLHDPPKDIGQALFDNIPNTEGLFWVDFTVFDIFPPP